MGSVRSMVIAGLFLSIFGCASLMGVVSSTTIDDIAGVWEGYTSELGTGYCRIDINSDGTGYIVSIADDGEEIHEIESIVFGNRDFILKPVYPEDLPKNEKYIVKGRLVLDELFLSLYEGTTIKDPKTGKEKKPVFTLSFLRDSQLTEYRERAAAIVEKKKREKAVTTD
jgi:hypothetical protein